MKISRDQLRAQGALIDTNKTLGAVLRARRKKLGYTQEQVAEMLAFSPRLVGEIERGRPTVGIDKVLLYATNIGIDVIAFER